MNLKEKLQPIFSDLESKYNLPSGLLDGIAHTESRYNPKAVSPVGAQGLFQFMPATAKDMGVNAFDPISSAEGAARYMRKLIDMNGGNLEKAVASYNWGIGNVQKKGLDNMPEETRKYIPSVMNKIKGNDMNPNFTPEEIALYEEEMKKMQPKQQIADFSPEEIALYEEEMKKMQASQEAMKQQQTPPPSALPKAQDNTNPSISGQASNVVINPAIAKEQLQKQNEMDLEKNIIETIGKLPKEKKLEFFNELTPAQRNIVVKSARKDLEQNGNQSSFSDFFFGGFTSEKGRNFIKDTGKKLTEGVLEGARDIRLGTSQLISKATGMDKVSSNINKEIEQTKKNRQLRDEIDPSLARDVGNIGLKTLTSFAIPGGQVSGLAGKTLLNVAARGAAGNVLMNPVVDNGDYATQKTTQAGVGALAGVVGQVAGEKVVKPLVEMGIRKFGKNITPAEDLAVKKSFENLQTPRSAVDTPNADPALLARSEKFARNNQDVKDFVKTQQKSLETNANKLSQGEIKNDQLIDNSFKEFKNYNGVRSKEVQEVTDSLKRSSLENPDEFVKNMANATLTRNKIKSDELYDKAAKEAEKIGNINISLNNSLSAYAKVKKEVEKTNARDLISSVKKAEENISDQFKNGANFNPVQINQSIKELGELARMAKKEGNTKVEGMFNQVRDTMIKELDDFVDSNVNNPALKSYIKAYKEAKSFNKENVQSIKDLELFKLTDSKGKIISNDKTIEDIIKKGRAEDLQIALKYLPEEGKTALRVGIVNKMIKNSSKSESGFDPRLFMTEFKSYEQKTAKNSNPLNLLFSKEQQGVLKDYANVVNNLKLYRDAIDKPNNGAKNLAFLENSSGSVRNALGVGAALTGAAATGGVGGLPVAAAALTAGAALVKNMNNASFVNKLLSSKTAQKDMMRLNTLNPRTEEFTKLATKITRELSGATTGSMTSY